MKVVKIPPKPKKPQHSYPVRFVRLASTRLTCWLGVLIAASEGIRAGWPEMMQMLPQWPWLAPIERWSLCALGFAVVYSRIRQELREQK